MCADTEVDLRQTTAKNSLVFTGNLAITINIFIKAVTHVSALLDCVVVNICLCAGNTLIYPAIELTDFFPNLSDIRTSNIRICTETEWSHLVIQRTQVGTNLMLQRMIVVAIGQRELEATVLHWSSVHCYSCVWYTSVRRYGHVVEQILRFVLIPLCCELNAVVEQSQVYTYVHRLFLLPRDILIDESRNSRTCNGSVCEAVSHIVTHHRCLIHVLTDILITKLTIAGTYLKHIDDITVDGVELLLVETPTDRYRREGAPTDILRQARAAITTDHSREQILAIIVVNHTTDERSQGMLILKRACITTTYCILNLQEVRFWEVYTPGIQLVGILLLISDTSQQIEVMQTDVSIIINRILNEEVSIRTGVLGQLLITLIQIYSIALNPSWYPSLILSMGLTIRKVELIVQFVILWLETNHLKQVNISRTSSHYTVNDGITSQQIVYQQGVRGRDVTMYCIIINTIAISIVVIAAGRTYFIIEHPCWFIISLNSRLH